jgi:hypothetical protein
MYETNGIPCKLGVYGHCGNYGQNQFRTVEAKTLREITLLRHIFFLCILSERRERDKSIDVLDSKIWYYLHVNFCG